MDPTQYAEATKAVAQAMGDSVLSMTRFLAAAGWVFAVLGWTAAVWAGRGMLKAERRNHEEAMRLAVSSFGTGTVVAKLARRRKPLTNPGLPPQEGA